MTSFKNDFALGLFAVFSLGTFLQQSGLCQESAQVATQSSSGAPIDSLTNSIGMALVPIPAGRFTMGSPASERGSQEDEVLHKVDITQAFHLGATEVTEHQWAMVMEEPFRTEVVEIRDPETKRLVKKEERQIKNPKLDSQLPVTGISWVQAVEFCKRLSQLPEEKKEGRTYRLPTEAEWEYACRAGTSTAYSFGDDASALGDYAWFAGSSRDSKPMPIAQKQANAWGLYDMHGNVAEWCHDYYGDYPEDLVSDPIGPAKLKTLEHLIRGGDFHSKESQLRSGYRGKEPGLARPAVGFRVLMGTDVLLTIENVIGQRFIKIPSGDFQMGGTLGDDKHRPVHQVVISRSFFISETEVTQGQWYSVMGTKPWDGQGGVRDGDKYPATYLSWQDSKEFCRRLSESQQEKAASRKYRLPTEAEWEYACRGRLTTEFYFGDDGKAFADLKNYAWYDENSTESPQLVGQKLPNGFGLYDMHGNVWEWCEDWYGNYDSSAQTDPSGPQSGVNRVFRSGSWRSKYFFCSSSCRFGNDPSFRSNSNGFRVVLVVD